MNLSMVYFMIHVVKVEAHTEASESIMMIQEEQVEAREDHPQIKSYGMY